MNGERPIRRRSHAPGVQFELRRSKVLGGIVLAMALAGLCHLIAWSLLGGGEGGSGLVRLLWGFLLWGLALALAVGWWRRMPSGRLIWDAEHWSLQLPGKLPTMAMPPAVRLDLQWVLLLQLRFAEHPRPIWLWLERNASPHQWQALRRALYSRARTGERQSGEIST